MARCHAGKKTQRTVGTFKRQQRELETCYSIWWKADAAKLVKNSLWSSEDAVCRGMMPKSKIHSVLLVREGIS